MAVSLIVSWNPVFKPLEYMSPGCVYNHRHLTNWHQFELKLQQIKMSGRGKGGKVKAKAKSRSSRAGLQFPVGRKLLHLEHIDLCQHRFFIEMPSIKYLRCCSKLKIFWWKISIQSHLNIFEIICSCRRFLEVSV